MMRCFFVLCVFIMSCAGESIPKGVFPKEKMIAVLYDIILADEWVDFKKMQDSSYMNFSKRAAIYDSVFQLHAIKKDQYQTSIRYYQSRPDLLKEIFESLKKKTDTTVGKPIKQVISKSI